MSAGSSRTVPLSKADDIEAISYGMFDRNRDGPWLDHLRGNPALAKQYGDLYVQMSENAELADPGRGRKPSVTPQELRDHGHPELAEEAELMGLSHV